MLDSGGVTKFVYFCVCACVCMCLCACMPVCMCVVNTFVFLG